MANQNTERMDTAVREELLKILRERVKNPTLDWETVVLNPSTAEGVAALQLIRAKYLTPEEGHITLAGTDYYRKESRPIRTWLKVNWFAVAVAVATVLAAVCGPFFDFLWGIVLP